MVSSELLEEVGDFQKGGNADDIKLDRSHWLDGSSELSFGVDDLDKTKLAASKLLEKTKEEHWDDIESMFSDIWEQEMSNLDLEHRKCLWLLSSYMKNCVLPARSNDEDPLKKQIRENIFSKYEEHTGGKFRPLYIQRLISWLATKKLDVSEHELSARDAHDVHAMVNFFRIYHPFKETLIDQPTREVESKYLLTQRLEDSFTSYKVSWEAQSAIPALMPEQEELLVVLYERLSKYLLENNYEDHSWSFKTLRALYHSKYKRGLRADIKQIKQLIDSGFEQNIRWKAHIFYELVDFVVNDWKEY